MEFEWDENKNAENFKKRGIDFEKAMSAFFDEWALDAFDEIHEKMEIWNNEEFLRALKEKLETV